MMPLALKALIVVSVGAALGLLSGLSAYSYTRGPAYASRPRSRRRR